MILKDVWEYCGLSPHKWRKGGSGQRLKIRNYPGVITKCLVCGPRKVRHWIFILFSIKYVVMISYVKGDTTMSFFFAL